MSLTVNTGGIARASIATPAERETDQALAAQDQATETLSQGLKRSEPSGVERLLARPDGLARFR